MILPLGAIPGFNLRHEMYVVAGHYGVQWRTLRQPRPRHEHVALARDALFWRLNVHCKLAQPRVAQMLGVGEQTVRDAVDRHARRISEFTASIKVRA